MLVFFKKDVLDGEWYVKAPLPYSYNPYSSSFQVKSYIDNITFVFQVSCMQKKSTCL